MAFKFHFLVHKAKFLSFLALGINPNDMYFGVNSSNSADLAFSGFNSAAFQNSVRHILLCKQLNLFLFRSKFINCNFSLLVDGSELVLKIIAHVEADLGDRHRHTFFIYQKLSKEWETDHLLLNFSLLFLSFFSFFSFLSFFAFLSFLSFFLSFLLFFY